MTAVDLSHVSSIYVDDGGVIQDNTERGRQWDIYLPQYLVQRFGGDHSSWAAANTEMLKRFMPKIVSGQGPNQEQSFTARRRRVRIEWTRALLEHAGFAPPDSDDECYQIQVDYTEYVTKRVRAAAPGAVSALRRLASAGYQLRTASGTESDHLQMILASLGIEELFLKTYGPDLIETDKSSPHFYKRIIEDSGVEAASALFLDDTESAVSRIVETGATACLIADTPPDTTRASLVLPGLERLPSALGLG